MTGIFKDRMIRTKYAGIKQVPELQHDKNRKEDSQMMHIHTARHVLKESQQSHQYNQESGTHTEYIVPHGRRYDKISTLARFFIHYIHARCNRRQCHCCKRIHNQIHPQHLSNRQRKFRT